MHCGVAVTRSHALIFVGVLRGGWRWEGGRSWEGGGGRVEVGGWKWEGGGGRDEREYKVDR